MLNKTKNRIYWGYIDIYEKLYIKRYRDDRAIENAEKFPLTKIIIDPFTAKSMHHARQKIMSKYVEEIINS